jgi:hypothetical protein
VFGSSKLAADQRRQGVRAAADGRGGRVLGKYQPGRSVRYRSAAADWDVQGFASCIPQLRDCVSRAEWSRPPEFEPPKATHSPPKAESEASQHPTACVRNISFRLLLTFPPETVPSRILVADALVFTPI